MNELRLSEIWIYPIKSLGGIRLTSAKVLEKGLRFDRRFMLVDEYGKFMTQRVHPTMALFKLSDLNDQFSVSHEADSLTIPAVPVLHGDGKVVQVWDDAVQAVEVGEEYNQWFSDRLKLKCKLVFFPEENARAVDPRYMVNNEHVSLADAYPLLIIGQRSLDDLNTRLAEPVPMNRFRPNLVFTGGEPYEEDTWREFTIGKNRFVGVKPCARCVLTTVNQDTGKAGKEPLRTLSTYRNRDGKVLFGQNLVAIDHQEIKEGDVITLV